MEKKIRLCSGHMAWEGGSEWGIGGSRVRGKEEDVKLLYREVKILTNLLVRSGATKSPCFWKGGIFFLLVSRIYGELALDYWVSFLLFLSLLCFIISFLLYCKYTHYVGLLLLLAHQDSSPRAKTLSSTQCFASARCCLAFPPYYMNEWLKKWHL